MQCGGLSHALCLEHSTGLAGRPLMSMAWMVQAEVSEELTPEPEAAAEAVEA